jgi:hypothetical protein
VHQKQPHKQMPWPQGCASRRGCGFSLREEMEITKPELSGVRVSTEAFIFRRCCGLTNKCQESVQSALCTHLGKSYYEGAIRYGTINIETLGLIQNDVSIFNSLSPSL